MSREVRRVPLDFDFPAGETWSGYLMPDDLRLPPCPDCVATGSTPAYQWLAKLAYRLGMLTEEVPGGRREQQRNREVPGMHPWLAQDPYPPTREIRQETSRAQKGLARLEIDRLHALGEGVPPYLHEAAREGGTVLTGYEVIRPSADLPDLVRGLILSGDEERDYYRSTGRDPLGSMLGWGDSVAHRMLVKGIIRGAGLDPETWGICPRCKGEGQIPTPEQKAAHEAWEPTPPPEGPGWQLWQTVTEGGPCSPVFPDREGLVTWLATDYRQVGSEQPMTRRQAEAFVDEGYSAGSGAILSTAEGTVMLSGEAAIFGRDGEPAEP